MKRFELSTLSLARRCSTTELHPQRKGKPNHLSIMHHRPAMSQWTAWNRMEAMDREGEMTSKLNKKRVNWIG